MIALLRVRFSSLESLIHPLAYVMILCGSFQPASDENANDEWNVV